MANTKLPSRLLDTSAIPALNVTGDLTVDTTTLKVDSTNNRVGIGTSSPDSKFVVSNGGAEGFEVFPGSASGQNSFQHYNRSGSAYLRNRNIASEFTFNLSGASDDAVTFKAGGNVGIGTDAPNSRLHVDHSISSTAANIAESKSVATISVSPLRNGSAYGMYFGNDGTNTGYVQVTDGTNASSMNINPFGGNVGIGTTSPAVNFHVNGTNASIGVLGTPKADWYTTAYNGLQVADGLTLWGRADDAHMSGNYYVKDVGGVAKDSYINTGYAHDLWFDNGSGDLKYRNAASGSANGQITSFPTRFIIKNNGNVGIGTSAPGFALDVSASIASTIGQTSTYNYGSNRNWAMRTNNYGSSNWGGWSLEQSTGQDLAPSVTRIGVHLNGNVGINMGGHAGSGLTSINPATALHVGGDITVGSADSVGTGGTASIRFQNDNERSRITSNYASGGGGQMGFWTDSTGGTLLQRMFFDNKGQKVTNNVKEYYERIYVRGSTSYTWDIDVKSVGASGQILEVFAGWTHYATSYAAVIKQIWSQRSTVQSDVVLIQSLVNYSTTHAGSWSVSWVDADTIRLTKNAGTHGSYGWGYILIRSPD